MADTLTLAAMREMTTAELAAKIAELEKERFALKFKAGTEVLGNPMDLRKARRAVAQLKTIQAERSRAQKA
jgi:large subunit ribosomal protein L29